MLRNAFWMAVGGMFLAALAFWGISNALAWPNNVQVQPNCDNVTVTANPQPYDGYSVTKIVGVGVFEWVNNARSGDVAITWSKVGKPDHTETTHWDRNRGELNCTPTQTPIPSATSTAEPTETLVPTHTNVVPTETEAATASPSPTLPGPTGTPVPTATEIPCHGEDSCGGKAWTGINFQPGDCARESGTAKIVTGGFNGKVYLTVHFNVGDCWSGWHEVEVPFGVNVQDTDLAVWWIPDNGNPPTQLILLNGWISTQAENMLEVDYP